MLRRQLTYVLVATVIGWVGGATNYFLWYDIPIPPIGNVLVSVYVLLVAYAIVRHRLLNIEVIVKKTLVFAGISFILFSLFAMTSFVMTGIYQKTLSDSTRLWLFAFVGMVVAIVVKPLDAFLIWVTDKYLFQKGYSYEEIQDAVAGCAEITDLKELTEKLVDVFASKMALETVALLLYDAERRVFEVSASFGVFNTSNKDFTREDPLLNYVSKSGKAVIGVDEIPEDKNPGGKSWFLHVMKPEILLKITYRSEVIALLAFGKKKSDREYTNDDMRFFETLAKQVANVINVAKSFHIQRDYYALQAEKNRIEMVAQLSVGIDHEIKNPLNQIRPRLQQIQLYYQKNNLRPNYDRLDEFVGECIENVDRIVSIMTRLRKFAHPVKPEELKLAPVMVKPFVDEAINLISGKQLEIDKIRIENSVPDNVCVFAEETSLVQVFYNLIANAYHAIDKDGTIRVSVKNVSQDGRIVVAVEDTGSGIKPENLSKIFDPFFTTKPTNPLPDVKGMRFKGTGLGLAFVKKYMEDLGGKINVASEVGKGTTFYLKFLKASLPSHAK